MARFGQSFLSALTQPSYGEGLFELGGAIGGTPADIAKKKAEQEKLEKQRQMAGLEAAGAESTARVQRARDDAIYRRAMQVAEKRKDVNAMQALEVKAIDPREYLSSTVNTGGNVTSSRSAGQYVDEKGHIYEVDIQRTPQGSRRSYIAVSPDAPETPVGKLTRVGGAYGETAAEKSGRDVETAGGKKLETDFAELRVNATEELPNLLSQRNDIDAAMAALDQIDTAGIPSQVENYLRRISGGQRPEVANYELLVGEAMFSRLKPLFGGVISEGEREAIMKLYGDLKRGNPANRSILEQMKRKLDEAIEKANLIRSSENFDEYNLRLNKFFPNDSEQGATTPVIDFVYDINTGDFVPR